MSVKALDDKGVHRPVFIGSSVIIGGLVLFAASAPSYAEGVFQSMQAWIVENLSWFYVLTVAIVLVSVIYFSISRFGDIRLGPEHSAPSYSFLSWFAMLFSAGMGIGLMFFGVVEPTMHFLQPPVGEAETIDAAKEALKLTFFHWGLHAWSIYAIVGLILAYFSFRRGLPLSLRSALYPLIGDRINGPVGDAIDTFAVIGTVLGAATSLGFGVSQINAGFAQLFGLPDTNVAKVLIVVFVMMLAMASVVSGLDKGVRRLSELNLGLAAILMILVLILGPTLFLIRSYVEDLGAYVSDLVNYTFRLYAYEPTDWLGGWTLLYWAWWLSWSPFVGMFIARISRGRTIREFGLGVLLVPAGFTLLWMTIFGNSAIYLIAIEGKQALAEATQENNAVALFQFFEYYPWSSVLSGVAVLMVIVFFVTSADSGALVVSMLAAGGRTVTPIWQRVYWSVMIGAVAVVLLLAGGLAALQAATIASALPFAIVLLWAIYGLHRALAVDMLKRESLLGRSPLPPTVGGRLTDETWRLRVERLADVPRARSVRAFIRGDVEESLEQVAAEMRGQGLDARVSEVDDGVRLSIEHGDERDFVYGVRMRSYHPPSFVIGDLDGAEGKEYYRAEVFLLEGGQGYDITGYQREQIIFDVLEQYENHLRFLDQIRG